MRYIVMFTIWMLTTFGCASGVAQAPGGQASTELTLHTVAAEGDTGQVVIVATNSGARPVAVVDMFGFAEFYFNLELTDESGARVVIVQPELFHEPRHRCLAPGKSLRFSVPLNSWAAISGRRDASCRGERCFSYHLAPGRYNIRAKYREPRNVAHRVKCDVIAEPTFSRWISITIRRGPDGGEGHR